MTSGGVQNTVATTEYERYTYDSGTNPYYSTQGPIVNTNLYLMDNFMNRKFTLNFEGCWLKSLRNVDLDYAKTDGTEVTCTFTLAYYKYNVFANDSEARSLIPDGMYQDDHDKLIAQDQASREQNQGTSEEGD